MLPVVKSFDKNTIMTVAVNDFPFNTWKPVSSPASSSWEPPPTRTPILILAFISLNGPRLLVDIGCCWVIWGHRDVCHEELLAGEASRRQMRLLPGRSESAWGLRLAPPWSPERAADGSQACSELSAMCSGDQARLCCRCRRPVTWPVPEHTSLSGPASALLPFCSPCSFLLLCSPHLFFHPSPPHIFLSLFPICPFFLPFSIWIFSPSLRRTGQLTISSLLCLPWLLPDSLRPGSSYFFNKWRDNKYLGLGRFYNFCCNNVTLLW